MGTHEGRTALRKVQNRRYDDRRTENADMALFYELLEQSAHLLGNRRIASGAEKRAVLSGALCRMNAVRKSPFPFRYAPGEWGFSSELVIFEKMCKVILTIS